MLKEIADERGMGHTFRATDVGSYFGEAGVTVPDHYFNGEGPDRAGCQHCGGCMVDAVQRQKYPAQKLSVFCGEEWRRSVG